MTQKANMQKKSSIGIGCMIMAGPKPATIQLNRVCILKLLTIFWRMIFSRLTFFLNKKFTTE